jgi:hypothetical protein
VTLVSHIHKEASFSLAVPGPSWGPGFFLARMNRIAQFAAPAMVRLAGSVACDLVPFAMFVKRIEVTGF